MKAALRREALRLLKQARLLDRVDRELWAAGRDVFLSDAELALWLATPTRSLQYTTPLKLLRTDAGRVRVLNLIGAVGNGGYL